MAVMGCGGTKYLLVFIAYSLLCWSTVYSVGIAYYTQTGAATCDPLEITAILVIPDDQCEDISLGEFKSFKIQCENSEQYGGTVCTDTKCSGTCSAREHVDLGPCDGSGEQMICAIPSEISGSSSFSLEFITWTSSSECFGTKTTFLLRTNVCVQLNPDQQEYIKLTATGGQSIVVQQFTDSACQSSGTSNTIMSGSCSDLSGAKITVTQLSGSLDTAYTEASGTPHVGASGSTVILLLAGLWLVVA